MEELLDCGISEGFSIKKPALRKTQPGARCIHLRNLIRVCVILGLDGAGVDTKIVESLANIQGHSHEIMCAVRSDMH